jgi:hypothetical protein
LVDGLTYDAENLRLVRTYPAEGLRREAQYFYFKVNPAPPDEAAPENGSAPAAGGSVGGIAA